jgi:photosystem II stability/assembly factor-like uncharacterized protein
MKHLLLFSLMVIVLILPVQAQDWQVVKEGDLQYLPDDGFFLNVDLGWIVCDDGVVLKTTDQGATWVTITIPDAAGIDLEDVEFADADTGYTCATDGFIYKTEDGGATWTMIGDTANYVGDLKGLSVVDAKTVYFCGKDSALFKTVDGGASITRSAYGFQGNDLDGGVSFISPTLGVVISDAKTSDTWYTHDGGENWEYVQLIFPAGTSSGKIYNVSGAGDSTFAIAGYHRLTFISNDGGKTYTASGDVEPGYEYFKDVQTLDANTIISSGSDGFVLRTIDGGTSWDTLYTGSGQTVQFHDFVNVNEGYVIHLYAQWKKTADGGQNWTNLYEWPAMSFWGLGMPTDDKLLITTWGGGELTQSTDAGATWTYPDNYTTKSTEHLYECTFSDANNGLIAGGYGAMRKTTDGGNTWVMVDNPFYQSTLKTFNALRYMNSDTVFAGGSKGWIIRSVDGGETWEQMKNFGTKTVYDIWAINNEQIMATGSSGQIYLSNTTLDTFDMANDYGSMAMRAVEFRGEVGIVPASSGHLYRTTIADVDTLYEVFTDPDGDDLYDVEFISDSVAYVVGEAGKIYVSSDTGKTWTAETSPTTETLHKVAYRNNILWAVGQNATIIKLDMTPNSIDNGKWQVVNYYELAQNYPNPFNPTTTISFSLEKAGHVELTVYNITGQKVVTLANREMNAGANKVVWDATHLASGIYFYRIASGDFVDIKKMTLIK